MPKETASSLSSDFVPHTPPSWRSWVPEEQVQGFGIDCQALIKLSYLLPGTLSTAHSLPDRHPDLPYLGVFAHAIPSAHKSLFLYLDAPSVHGGPQGTFPCALRMRRGSIICTPLILPVNL